MIVYKNVSEIAEKKGEHIGISPWMTIDQKMIDKFAEATCDFN